jgi:hypothetical protein
VALRNRARIASKCGGVESVTDSKPELILLQRPSAEEILALFERISGRQATAAEKQEVAELAEARRRADTCGHP